MNQSWQKPCSLIGWHLLMFPTETSRIQIFPPPLYLLNYQKIKNKPSFYNPQKSKHSSPVKDPDTRQWGIMRQFSALQNQLDLPFQLVKSSTTTFGITQGTPTHENTMVQSFLATMPWKSRWLVVSPSLLHMQHQSSTTNLRFWRLSVVRISPKSDLCWKLGFHKLFKERIDEVSSATSYNRIWLQSHFVKIATVMHGILSY